jgi:hypothetical protein
MMTDTIQKFREIYQGYQPWANPVDVEVVREMGPCGACGGQMLFAGYQRNGERHAIAYCAECGDASEF